ncbi:MAG: tRNA lysidine(34) synthetase TilS [Flavobacteriaceae bacterium]|nr:tRNA lysidine(34) synthetase TilS [Flavobacteriaceae bacterium]
MLSKFQSHLDARFSFLKNEKLLVACSGGLDSVVLTHLLVKCGYDVTLAHCNFSLRGNESDTDSQFVIQLSKKLKLPVFTEIFETEQFADEHGLSIQMAARTLRYQWFEELSGQLKIKYILTGHHLDDDLETFLINFSRGTGLKGLTGIPEYNQKIIRPLLAFSRSEILAFAERHNLNWREDSSNFSNKYVRNALRLDVIPKWKDTTPDLLQSYKTTREYLKNSELLIEDYIALIFSYVVEETEEGYKFSVSKLEKLPNLKALLYELLVPFGFTAWDDIYQLLSAQSGKQVVSKTHILLKNRDYLILQSISSDNSHTDSQDIQISRDTQSIEKPVKVSFERVKELGDVSKETIFVDYDLLKFPLKLRRWREADVFHPFGMTGKKKISKFFKDEKLSLLAKKKIWLLLSGDEVVWVMGLRADNRFKVTSKTNTILKIQLQ